MEPPGLNDEDISILNPRVRRSMALKIAAVLVPFPDRNALHDVRMQELTEYVKYMERKTFERATSRDNYYSRLACIIYRLQKQMRTRPRGPDNDPYSNIPPSHQLADFMGLTQEELEEFDNEWNPPAPSFPDNSKETITRHIRRSVVDKLGSLLFPPPDPFAYLDGRMDKITTQLKQIEARAFHDCASRDEYYNLASVNAYSLQKSLKRKGESYVNKIVKHPCIVLRTEIIND